MFRLPIPLYDPDQALHRRLVAAAATAEEVANAVPLPAGMDFKAARQRVRHAVYSHGVAREIDELSATLLAEAVE